MPRVGTRKATARRLEKTSKLVLSALSKPTPHSPYLLRHCLQLELMQMASVVILSFDDLTFLIQAASLHLVFRRYLLIRMAYNFLVSKHNLFRLQYLNVGLALGKIMDDLEILRYIEPRIHHRNMELQQSRFQHVLDGCDRTFIKLARMSKAKFMVLFDLIRLNPIFQNSSNTPQCPVEWQLLVTLTNLGLSGNGGSPYVIALMFSISEGTVHNFTYRCFVALLALESSYVYWPDSQGRQKIKLAIGQVSSFKDCIGFIDGTLIPLAFAPQKDPEDYWTRKYFYAFNSMLVCDHEGRIIYALHGWCGSAHDQRIFASSQLSQQPENFFSNNEYLLADSGYTCTNNIIPTYKRSHSRALDPHKRDFNTHLSKLRVTVEHCNGMLKGRFQSLRTCNILVKGEESAIKFNRWIRVCCILHNFLLKEGDPWFPITNEDGIFFDNTPVEIINDFTGPSSYSRRNSLLNDFGIWNRPGT